MSKKILLPLFLLLVINVYSQKQSIVGVGFSIDRYNYSNTIGYGISYEYQYANHWGYEFGVFSRNQAVLSPIITHFVSVPIMFKYYSQLVNISVGANAHYFTGFTNLNPIPNTITTVTVNPSLEFGLIGKISKSISLSQKLILEPELSINPLLASNNTYYSLGLNLKYKL